MPGQSIDFRLESPGSLPDLPHRLTIRAMKPRPRGQELQARDNRHVRGTETMAPALDEEDLYPLVQDNKDAFILILDCVQAVSYTHLTLPTILRV